MHQLQPPVACVSAYHIFVDGSFFKKDSSCAWAFEVVLQQPGLEFRRWGYTGASFSDAPSSLSAEARGALAALHWICCTLVDCRRPVTLYCDSTCIGLGLAGAQKLPDAIGCEAGKARAMYQLAKSLVPHLQYRHVKHSGQVDNEVVDSVAKALKAGRLSVEFLTSLQVYPCLYGIGHGCSLNLTSMTTLNFRHLQIWWIKLLMALPSPLEARYSINLMKLLVTILYVKLIWSLLLRTFGHWRSMTPTLLGRLAFLQSNLALRPRCCWASRDSSSEFHSIVFEPLCSVSFRKWSRSRWGRAMVESRWCSCKNTLRPNHCRSLQSLALQLHSFGSWVWPSAAWLWLRGLLCTTSSKS